ncbi:MAG: hypothetical protein AAGM38_09340 [Pseudomonadota bacterium]
MSKDEIAIDLEAALRQRAEETETGAQEGDDALSVEAATARLRRAVSAHSDESLAVLRAWLHAPGAPRQRWRH